MDPPTLRALVSALTLKLADFADANAHNASVAAAQMLSLTARAEAGERRAAEAGAEAAAAREAGEAAGAALFKEAARLRAQLEGLRAAQGQGGGDSGSAGSAGSSAEASQPRDAEVQVLLAQSAAAGGGSGEAISSE